MIKTFQQVLKLAAIMGIASDQHPFNWRNDLAIGIFSFGIILNGAYIFGEAKSFQQYADSIFMATTLAGVLIIFTFLVANMRLIFDCLSEEEKMIDDSEFRFFSNKISLH